MAQEVSNSFYQSIGIGERFSEPRYQHKVIAEGSGWQFVCVCLHPVDSKALAAAVMCLLPRCPGKA